MCVVLCGGGGVCGGDLLGIVKRGRGKFCLATLITAHYWFKREYI